MVIERRHVMGGQNLPYAAEVEYIESDCTNSQYIDTGVFFTGPYEASLTFSIPTAQSESYSRLMGVGNDNGSPYHYCTVETQNNKLSAYSITNSDTSGGTINVTANTATTKQVLVLNNTSSTSNTLTFNGGSETSGCTINYSKASVGSVYLFCIHRTLNSGGTVIDDSAVRFTSYKLYACSFKIGGELVRDFIPVLDNHGIACLYDKVSKQLFYNQGNGYFDFGEITKLIRTPQIPSAYDISYSGDKVIKLLTNGTYKLQCWGGQGGSYSSTYYGGKGGYSEGTLTVNDLTKVYLYAGGMAASGATGTTGVKSGGFNGGGNGYSTTTTYLEYGGGGASDIRIGTDSLYARVIVAGGGGGVGSYNGSNRYNGGYGGGQTGGTGGQYSTSYRGGGGGTQTTYGTSYYGTTTNSSSYGIIAAFGVGAGAGSSTSYQIAGGGGGWYGGGYSRRGAGGGGSGYVYKSDTASDYPSGCLLNSSYYLTNASTMDGSVSFESVEGGTETGHSGNGYVRITKIS